MPHAVEEVGKFHVDACEDDKPEDRYGESWMSEPGLYGDVPSYEIDFWLG